MHSKWQIWDFFKSFSSNYLGEFQGVLALCTFDSVGLMLVKDFLTSGLDSDVLKYKMASEVTHSWIEDEFETLSLFQQQSSFFIHQAENLSLDIIDRLSSLEINDRFIILSFEKDSLGRKKLLKEKKIEAIMIEPPRFWEMNKLLDFLCSHLKIPLSYQSRRWLLDAIENDLGSFYNACSLLKINFPNLKQIELLQVKDVLSFDRLDKFQLVSLLAKKKNHLFYEKLTSLEGDFEKMRSFFMFIQSHLIKMIDPCFLQKKSYLSQYDKELQRTSHLWKDEELFNEIKKFSDWEILCKKKDSSLWHEIKQQLLRSWPCETPK